MYNKRWFVLWLGLFSLAAQAGISPSFCTDITAEPVTPSVDFETQIQPIFTSRCTSCHGSSGGLTLTAGSAYGNLVSVSSTAPVPVNRVEPGLANSSFLFWKVNCDSPGFGSRMPAGGVLSAAEQALIRDWINQGALPAAAAAPTPVPGPSAPWLLLLSLMVLVVAGLTQRRRA